MDAVTLAAAQVAAAKNYKQAAWSVVSTRPVKLGDGATANSTTQQTTRLSEVAPYDLVALRLVYANWQNAFSSSEAPNYSAIRVAAAVHRAGIAAPARDATDPLYPVTFAGNAYGICAGGSLLLSDPIRLKIAAGERWWHESYADVLLPAGPAAPTLTAAAGGALPASTVAVVITYVYADGAESLPSAEATVAVTANQQVTVTAPASSPAAVGWRAYFGSGANNGKYELPNLPVTSFSSNIVYGSTISGNALYRFARTATHPGLPLGRGQLAGVGENSVNNRDYTATPTAWASSTGSYASFFSPIGVLGIAADGRIHPSPVIIGDSIDAGTGDDGYGGALGGAAFRAFANQTAQVAYDSTKTPKCGFLTLAQGGESVGLFVTAAGGARRRAVVELGTDVFDGYGTNDLGSGAAALYANVLSYFTLLAGRKKFFRRTLDPKTTSTDGWQTVANQTSNGASAEGDRRAFNNLVRDTTGAVAVTGENLFRAQSANPTPATTLTGGDGTTTRYLAAYPFRTGTETVQVNGTTKTVTTDYTYYGTATIDGATHASGVTFISAPANGATVTASYTKVASFGARTGYSGYFDTASAVEVDAAGNPTLNGGWWKAPTVAAVTGTATGSTATSLTDSAQTWTTDQYRGWLVIITADSGNPTAVGQVTSIITNSATVLTFRNSWPSTPSATASYKIYRGYTADGIHGQSQARVEQSQKIDTTKL